MERVCRVTVFSTAVRELGSLDTKYNRGKIKLFDGTTFDADDPITYLNNLKIKRDFSVAEIVLDPHSRAA
nr:hypothetical protein [Pleurocapsa sp. FMAR1]